MSSVSCPSCGSSNVVDDELYSQPQVVCADCGFVLSEGALANDPLGGSDVSYRQTTAVVKKPCVNLIKGLQRVRAICRILRVHSEIEELSQTYYQQSYQHQHFIKVALQKKEVLTGCCVLLSCRLRNWPITMGTISYLVEADPMVVGGIYQEMVEILKVETPIVNITDEMEGYCQEYKITSSHVPEDLAENHKDLTKRAVALVELAADTWIVTGRKPVPIMMASIFLSWQSLRPTRKRLRFSLEKFCKLAKVKNLRPTLKRVAELKEVLCKLGRELPWVRDAVTPDNVALQVEDILNHRYALFRSALRTHENALLTEQGGCDDLLLDRQAGAEAAAAARVSGFDSQTPNTSCVEASVQDSKKAERAGDAAANSCTTPDLHSSTGTPENHDQHPNWGKRVLFAPPCVTHPKKRRVQRSEPSDVTGDEEISDSEIDSYLRTPQEAQVFALSQKVLCSSRNEEE
ncbi:transcription factor IIIB 50 kDa subunit-like [Thalassophryne amazonica]|uniref:transcription factor IIIB 50 kDa subunit-like n=1 Tax=Thalassophryne amazonica TaxID=390379 RepID=UPI001471BA0B|nr:transcription factor IIIB 50 kDa subunit-like [Thalassophryne amazonica]